MLKTFSLKDRAVFSKKFSFLLSAGIPFIQALSIMEEREKEGWKKHHLKTVISRIRSGKGICASFDFKPFLFDAASIGIIRSAEMSGTLSRSFDRLATDIEAKLSDSRRLAGMMIYPACIIFFSAALVSLLLFLVFPKILPLLSSSDAPLPFSTKLLLGIFTIIQSYGIYLLIFCILWCGASLWIWKCFPKARRSAWRYVMKCPGLGLLIRSSKTAATARLISLFVESGYTLAESLSLIGTYEKHPLYGPAVANLFEDIKKGRRFSSALSDHALLFSLEMSQFAAIGEESGTLSKSLRELSRFIEDDIKNIEKKVFSLIEPLLMLFLGLIVGFIALSLVAPIYSLTSSLNQPPA